MIQTFTYNFTPRSLDLPPARPSRWDLSAIEEAGIREVLQAPAQPNGGWSILDALLALTGAGTSFIVRQPLGQAHGVRSRCRAHSDGSWPAIISISPFCPKVDRLRRARCHWIPKEPREVSRIRDFRMHRSNF
jgi:hypothetical protein